MTTKALSAFALVGAIGALCSHPHLGADPPAKTEKAGPVALVPS